MIRVVFVCLGNICRSPTAEGIFRHLIQLEKLQHNISCESRGTGPWHIGEEPDLRSQECMRRNGLDISDLRGRQFSVYDFEIFDRILVMDQSNMRDVLRLATSDSDRKKVDLLLSYSQKAKDKNVPDPYHGGPEGFQNVFRLIEDSCLGLLKEIKQNL